MCSGRPTRRPGGTSSGARRGRPRRVRGRLPHPSVRRSVGTQDRAHAFPSIPEPRSTMPRRSIRQSSCRCAHRRHRRCLPGGTGQRRRIAVPHGTAHRHERLAPPVTALGCAFPFGRPSTLSLSSYRCASAGAALNHRARGAQAQAHAHARTHAPMHGAACAKRARGERQQAPPKARAARRSRQQAEKLAQRGDDEGPPPPGRRRPR